jgi:hypothetical protein
MRPRFFLLPDLLSLLAIAALAVVVYLCSLPQTMHSAAHRRTAAIELLAAARESIEKERALIPALVVAADRDSREMLRQAALDNERHFHESVDCVAAKMPDLKGEVKELAGQFDALVALGRSADDAARRDAMGEAQDIVQDHLLPALKQLGARAQAMESGLQLQESVKGGDPT